MAGTPDDTRPESWHRYFAIEANNQAWALAELPSRTPAQVREMLNAAHTAALHWDAVGSELHHMRGLTLLAQAHALAGNGRFALQLVDTFAPFFSARDTDDWETAFVHTIDAFAAAVAGEAARYRTAYAAAAAAVEAIADEEDRAIVMRTFEQVPTP